MASPGQKRGGCGHLMDGFDTHSCCVRCYDKGTGPDPCVEKLEYSDFSFRSILTSDQHAQLSTPSYKLKKEKRDSKKTDKTATPIKEPKDTLSPSLVDPSLVSVVDGQGTVQFPGLSAPAEKRKKVEKETASTSKSVKDKTTKPPVLQQVVHRTDQERLYLKYGL